MDHAKVARDLQAEAKRLEAEAERIVSELRDKANRLRKAAEILVPPSNGSPAGKRESSDSGSMSDRVSAAATGRFRTIAEICAATGFDRKQVTRALFRDKKNFEKQIREPDKRPEFRFIQPKQIPSK